MSRQTRTKAQRRRERAHRELAGKGWLAILLGVMLLAVIPSFLRGSMASAMGPALRPAGWAALAIGVALLCLHYILRRAAAPPAVERTEATPTFEAAAPQVPPKDARQEPVFSPDLPPEPRGSSPKLSRHQERHWTPAVLAAIEWRRFEAVCEAFFAQAGLATRSQSHGADGGVDIWLQSRHVVEPRIVQCKHWQSKPVGVKEVREFLGVMASHKLQNGTYVTSSTFTADALAFAKANGIQAQDGATLLKLIGLRTPEQQAALLAVAYEGEYWRPTCASCGTKMAERTSGKDGRGFWGCANYPRCRGRTIPRAVASA